MSECERLGREEQYRCDGYAPKRTGKNAYTNINIHTHRHLRMCTEAQAYIHLHLHKHAHTAGVAVGAMGVRKIASLLKRDPKTAG